MSTYILLEDFKGGLDTRRSALTSKPGTLQICTNAHITRGGEIEKRKAFATYAALPPGTFGLQSAASTLNVFGSNIAPAMPTGVSYQRLQHKNGVTAMTSLLSSANFNGKIYAIAGFADGAVYHYYDGVRVSAWDGISTVVGDNTGVAAALGSKINAVTPFSATSSLSVVTITANDVNVAFTAPLVTAVNGGSANNQTLTFATTTAASAGVAQVSTITVGGTFEVGDIFTLSLQTAASGTSTTYTFIVSGSAAGAGITARTFQKKLYSTARSLLYFSVLSNPSLWSDTSTSFGSGFINMSNETAGSEDLTAVAAYQQKLAVFSRSAVQLWTIDSDPVKNAQWQVLSNIGTNAAKSVTSFGDLDVFFLADSGIRSLRARDASNAATVSDIGTAIDTLVTADIISVGPSVRDAAVGVIEPQDGRYWLAMGPKIYVFSYFPTPGVSAWSTYEPGFVVSAFSTLASRVYARSGDTLYLYGGQQNLTYDNCPVNIVLPYLDGGKPAHAKSLRAVDLTCEGTWGIYSGCNHSAPNVRDLIGTTVGSTWDKDSIPGVGIGTHLGIQLISNTAGYARISNCAVHFDINAAS